MAPLEKQTQPSLTSDLPRLSYTSVLGNQTLYTCGFTINI